MKDFNIYLELVPDDVVLHLLMSFDIASVLKFRQTCRRNLRISHTKQLWVSLYRRETLRRNTYYAPYWKHIDDLLSTQLETLVLHASRLRNRIITRRTPLVVPFNQIRSVTWVRLIQSQWLLVASSDDVSSAITLWSVPDLLSSILTPLAEAFLPAPVVNGAVDRQGSYLLFALELRGRTDQIHIFSIVDYGVPKICRLQVIENAGQLRFIKGSTIGLSLIQNLCIPCIMDWQSNHVYPFQQHPNNQGGAIAMYPGVGWIAVVRRKSIEIYVFRAGHSELWKTLTLPHFVGSAIFSQLPLQGLSNRFRLCITCQMGIFVFEVYCDIKRSILEMKQIWYYDPPMTEELSHMAARGMLGVTATSVSWLEGDELIRNDHTVKFCTAPLVGDLTKPDILEWYSDVGPALYALGVFDFDEARGILVVGNAFGELSIIDFSGSNPLVFFKCLQRPLLPSSYTGREVLSTTPIHSYPGPPFPIFIVPEQVRSDMLQNWKILRPSASPEGWTTDFDNIDAIALFRIHGSIFDSLMLNWRLDNAGHFYGRLTPLLYRKDANDVEWMICDIGGLLFVYAEEIAVEFLLARPGVTLSQLAQSINDYHCLADTVKHDFSVLLFGSRLWSTWKRECRMLKRNRCAELHARGGRMEEYCLV